MPTCPLPIKRRLLWTPDLCGIVLVRLRVEVTASRYGGLLRAYRTESGWQYKYRGCATSKRGGECRTNYRKEVVTLWKTTQSFVLGIFLDDYRRLWCDAIKSGIDSLNICWTTRRHVPGMVFFINNTVRTSTLDREEFLIMGKDS
jgi:hypothetical protein